MKKITSLSSRLVCSTVIMFMLTIQTAKSQTFPFSEDFDSTPDNTLPSGWSKNYEGAGGPYYADYINVFSNEGIGNSKAAMLRVSSTWIWSDTLVSPVIGPITTNTILNVNYKFIQAPTTSGSVTGPYAAGSFNSPFFVSGAGFTFKIAIINTSNNTRTEIFLADSTNHISTMAYTLKALNLSSFSGQNIKVEVIFGGYYSENYFSEFWIDNMTVNDYTVSVDNSLDQKERTNVFPNPTKGELTFRCNENVTATVCDIAGRILYQENITEPTHTMYLDKNPAGLYLVNVKGANTNKTYRIIKQ